MQLIVKLLKFIFFCSFVVKELSFNGSILKQNTIVNKVDNLEINESVETEENINSVEDTNKDVYTEPVEEFEKLDVDVIQNINDNLSIDSTNNIEINENINIDVIQDNLSSEQSNNEQMNDEQQNKVEDYFTNNNIATEDIYPTVEDCNAAALEIAFKDTADIINVYCFSVAENGKLLGYRPDINCLSGNCEKYK